MHYWSPSAFTEALGLFDIKKIDQVYTNTLNTSDYSTKDFAVERNKEDISLFNEVVRYIGKRVKKHSIILSGHSEGSIKRLLSVLKEHGLSIVRKIDNIGPINVQ